jgi:hypothetical protein
MRSRFVSTLAALVAGAALTVGTAGVLGSAFGGGADSSPPTTYQAGKIMPRSDT